MTDLQVKIDDKFTDNRELSQSEVKEMITMLLGIEQTKKFIFEEDLGIDRNTRSMKFRHVIGVNKELENRPLSRIFTIRFNEVDDVLSIRDYDSMLITTINNNEKI